MSKEITREMRLKAAQRLAMWTSVRALAAAVGAETAQIDTSGIINNGLIMKAMLEAGKALAFHEMQNYD